MQILFTEKELSAIRSVSGESDIGEYCKNVILSEIKKQKRKARIKEKNDFLDSVIELFLDSYLAERGENYIVLQYGKERQAVGSLINLYKKRKPEANTDEMINDMKLFFLMCLQIEDSFYYNNMSPGLIVARYNQIVQILKNGNDGSKKRRTEKNREAIARRIAEAHGE